MHTHLSHALRRAAVELIAVLLMVCGLALIFSLYAVDRI